MNGLHAAIGGQLSEGFLSGTAPVELSGYVVKSIARDIDLQPMRAFLTQAMTRFSQDDRAKSDGWLAPRLHYALRLTRREAADRGLWRYLAIAEFPDYVRWRWTGNKGVQLERFVGPDYKHALGRLWWAAELTRDGRDYGPAAKMFEMQDINNNWQRMNMFHNRPMAVSAVRYMSTLNSGSIAVGDDVNMLAKAVNLVMTTTVLDAMAPDTGPDPVAVEHWIGGTADETRFSDDLPEGPDEDPVPSEQVERVTELMQRVAKALPLHAWRKATTEAEGSEVVI